MRLGRHYMILINIRFFKKFILQRKIAMQQKILGTIFVNSMWFNATNSACIKLQPKNCGWALDVYLQLTGFIGDQTSLTIRGIMTNRFDDQNFS